jgi:acyl-homoserine lactone acylase PvdQ
VQVEDPAQGYLQSDNVAPDRLFRDGNLSAASYPDYLFNDTAGRITTRGVRALAVLSSVRKLDLAAATALAVDATWVTAADWRAALAHAVAERPDMLRAGSETSRRFVARLLEFDGVAAADSIAALDFYYWRRGMEALLVRPELAALRTLPWDAATFTPAVDEALLSRALQAAGEMERELGSIDVPLGTVFRIGRGERSWPLGGESIEMPAIPDCLAAYSPLCERTMRAFASGVPNERHERRAYRGTQALLV